MAESVKIGALILLTHMIGTACPPTTVVTQTLLLKTSHGAIRLTPMRDGNIVIFQCAQARDVMHVRRCRPHQRGAMLCPTASAAQALQAPTEALARSAPPACTNPRRDQTRAQPARPTLTRPQEVMTPRTASATQALPATALGDVKSASAPQALRATTLGDVKRVPLERIRQGAATRRAQTAAPGRTPQRVGRRPRARARRALQTRTRRRGAMQCPTAPASEGTRARRAATVLRPSGAGPPRGRPGGGGGGGGGGGRPPPPPPRGGGGGGGGGPPPGGGGQS